MRASPSTHPCPPPATSSCSFHAVMTTKYVKLLDLDNCIVEAIPWCHAIVETSSSPSLLLAEPEEQDQGDASNTRAATQPLNDQERQQERQEEEEEEEEEETIPLVVFSVDFYVDDAYDANQTPVVLPSKSAKKKKLMLDNSSFPISSERKQPDHERVSHHRDHPFRRKGCDNNHERDTDDNDSLCTISTSETVLCCLTSSSCEIQWDGEDNHDDDDIDNNDDDNKCFVNDNDLIDPLNVMMLHQDHHHHQYHHDPSFFSCLETTPIVSNDTTEEEKDDTEDDKDAKNNKDRSNLSSSSPPPSISAIAEQRDDLEDEYYYHHDDEFICVGDLPRIY